MRFLPPESSYLTYILLRSELIPVVIKWVELGNAICDALLSSHHDGCTIPLFVNDVAVALPWILVEAPPPLGCSCDL
jgi:hypothetical protein